MSGDDFGIFFKQREKAAAAYTNGDPTPVLELVPDGRSMTFLSPKGDVVEGADAVASRFKADAGAFQPGGETELEMIQSEQSGDLAFWTGLQRAKVRMAGKQEAAEMTIRVTEVFRREDGQWKMIHRHADMAKAVE